VLDGYRQDEVFRKVVKPGYPVVGEDNREYIEGGTLALPAEFLTKLKEI